jgi:hypothetical protein
MRLPLPHAGASEKATLPPASMVPVMVNVPVAVFWVPVPGDIVAIAPFGPAAATSIVKHFPKAKADKITQRAMSIRHKAPMPSLPLSQAYV